MFSIFTYVMKPYVTQTVSLGYLCTDNWFSRAFVLFFEQKKSRTFQELSRTNFPFFSPFSGKKRLESTCMSFLVLPQHEQFYPERLSMFAPFPLG